MKLSGEQIMLKQMFRDHVIDLFWDRKKVMMFNIHVDIAEKLCMDEDEVYDKLTDLPSIRPYGPRTPIQAWLAKHYQPVAYALWMKKPKEEVLAIWGKLNYTKASQPYCKRSKADLTEMARARSNDRKNMAIAELHKNMPDRWGKTDWNKVK